MIRTENVHLGKREPIISIGVPATKELADIRDAYIRYIKTIDLPGVEIVFAYVEDESWHESKAKNAMANAAMTDYLALTAMDDHPSASLVVRTRMELDACPDAVVIAMKLEGLPTHRAAPNPFALGDWICMRREKYLALGGYNEGLESGCWFENEFLGRAIVAGHDVVMLDERIFHGWHPRRENVEEWGAASERTKNKVLASGMPLAVFYYPSVGQLQWQDHAESFSVLPQTGSVLNSVCHHPYNDDYWECVMQDKQIRLGAVK